MKAPPCQVAGEIASAFTTLQDVCRNLKYISRDKSNLPKNTACMPHGKAIPRCNYCGDRRGRVPPTSSPEGPPITCLYWQSARCNHVIGRISFSQTCALWLPRCMLQAVMSRYLLFLSDGGLYNNAHTIILEFLFIKTFASLGLHAYCVLSHSQHQPFRIWSHCCFNLDFTFSVLLMFSM